MAHLGVTHLTIWKTYIQSGSLTLYERILLLKPIHHRCIRHRNCISLWIRIVDPKTNQELFAIKNDPRKAAVFYSSVERQIELSAQKAFTQVKKPLHEKLNQLLGKMATTGREVRIVIDNYTESFSDELRIIVKAVENIPGSSNVNMKVNDIEQTATISLNYTATTESLEGFLQARLKKDIEYPVRRPKTKNISANTLTMTY